MPEFEEQNAVMTRDNSYGLEVPRYDILGSLNEDPQQSDIYSWGLPAAKGCRIVET